MIDNKRRFKRIPFDASIKLRLSDNQTELSGQLHDISLKGALIVVDEASLPVEVDTRAVLFIEQGEMKIVIECEIAYTLEARQTYGLNLLSMDVDSASHLRRLIEVNLGDENELQRELSNLVTAMEDEHLS